MFSYEEIQKYNETDIRIYKYILSNIDKILYMTIRELAEEVGVSTSTILRFCDKNQLDGYTALKDALKKKWLCGIPVRPWRTYRSFRIFSQGQIRALLRRSCCLRWMRLGRRI